MRYERPVKREEGLKKFELGTHIATIKKVTKKKSKNGNDMFMLFLEGKNKERGVFFLTFGNDYTEDNLNYLLASIEDNGVEIPSIPFGYNKETFQFLLNKEVYISVEEKPFNGVLQPQIATFLTLEEFENSEEFNENETELDDWE